MVEHVCRDGWAYGRVENCSHHTQRGKSAADVRPYNDLRFRKRTEGIAKTGQVSNKGTVTHTDYWSGRVAALARPTTIREKFSENEGFTDKWDWRNGRWIHKATGKELNWQTTVGNSAFGGGVL